MDCTKYGVTYDEYFDWLCALVNADKSVYGYLLASLYNIEFTWTMDLDRSRAVEGLELRKQYCDLVGGDTWVMLAEDGCTVLEMLIALARRMDDMFTDVDTADRSRIWFWEFIENLGLKKFTNNCPARFEEWTDDEGLHVSAHSPEEDIFYIVHRWLNREYDPDGQGSIFPVGGHGTDMREASIFYQMSRYFYTKEG